jgi:hypothetical protein
MPFKKLGHGRYRGPTGRTFDKAQVKLYYSLGGQFPGQKSDRAVAAKGRKAAKVKTHSVMKRP